MKTIGIIGGTSWESTVTYYQIINEKIKELCLGIVKEESRKYYLDVISHLKEQGAECVVLGCTEIGMLINKDNSPLPVFDTAIIHPEEAAKLALIEK